MAGKTIAAVRHRRAGRVRGGTRWDLNQTGSLSDRTLSIRGSGG
jgi:hypothetical protein